MNLARDSVPLIAEALRNFLQNHNKGEMVGVTCLTRGSDQIFARVVLKLAAQLK
jgi:hypothetical protein